MTRVLHAAAGWPPVSIVVPVRNAARTLRHCVGALRAQEYPGGRYELIFVDNGSTDTSRQILEEVDYAVRVVDEPRRGASAARNAGVAAASYDWIAFTDADCVPHPDWLRNLVAHAAAHPDVDFVGGAIVALEPCSPVERFAERLLDQRASIEEETPPYAITANLLVRATMLGRLGGFDPAALRGQDVDLSFRAFLEHGARFSFAVDAVVEHVNVDTVRGLFLKGIQHGRATGFIYRKYARRLGYRPWHACVRPARYARILGGLGTAAGAAVRRAWRAESVADEEVRHPFYAAVFAMGKQAGLVLQNLSRRGRSSTSYDAGAVGGLPTSGPASSPATPDQGV